MVSTNDTVEIIDLVNSFAKVYDGTTNNVVSVITKVKDLCRRLRMYTYLPDELEGEIESIPAHALRHFGEFIFNTIVQHQKDTSLILFAQTYFKEKNCTIAEYVAPTDVLEEYDDIELTPSSNIIIDKFNILFDGNNIVDALRKKFLLKKFVTLLNNRDLSSIMKLSYENDLLEVIMFLYVFCKVPFDYTSLIESSETFSAPTSTAIADVVQTGSSNCRCPISFQKSKNSIKIFNYMMYLKTYSRMCGPKKFVFVAKNYNIISSELRFNAEYKDVCI